MNRTTLHRTRPALATIVAFLALFVALGSGSYAAGLLTGKDVKNGSLTGKDLKTDSVTGEDVRDLTGGDLDESSLGTVPEAAHATNADHATTADRAKDADTGQGRRQGGRRTRRPGPDDPRLPVRQGPRLRTHQGQCRHHPRDVHELGHRPSTRPTTAPAPRSSSVATRSASTW